MRDDGRGAALVVTGVLIAYLIASVLNWIGGTTLVWIFVVLTLVVGVSLSIWGRTR